MVAPRQQAGFDAEARAEAFLAGRGLVPVARNVRFRGGEIDLVMRDGEEWVFVEVRARADARFGGAAASVDGRKQRRLALAAQMFLLRRFGQREAGVSLRRGRHRGRRAQLDPCRVHAGLRAGRCIRGGSACRRRYNRPGSDATHPRGGRGPRQENP